MPTLSLEVMAGKISKKPPRRSQLHCAALFGEEKTQWCPPLSSFGCKVRDFIVSELFPCLLPVFIKPDVVYLTAETRCRLPFCNCMHGLLKIKATDCHQAQRLGSNYCCKPIRLTPFTLFSQPLLLYVRAGLHALQALPSV